MVARTPLTSEQIKWFRASWLAEMPLNKICKTLHIHDIRARQMAESMGLPPHVGNKRVMKSAEIEQIKKLRAEGLKVHEIMAITGRALGTISKYTGEARRKWTAEDRQRAHELYREYRSYKKVADIIGATERTISEWIQGFRGRLNLDDDRTVVPPHVWAERNYRMSLMRRDDPSQMFGDPLPGYSYLERRA